MPERRNNGPSGAALRRRAIIVTLFALLLMTGLGCKRSHTFQIEKVVYEGAEVTSNQKLAAEIAKEFTEEFINAYRGQLEVEVPGPLRTNLPLSQGSINIQLITSTQCESSLQLSPGQENALSVTGVTVPVQAALFGGFGLINGNNGFSVNGYETAQASINNINMIFVVTDLGLQAASPKFFGFAPNSRVGQVIMRGVRITCAEPPNIFEVPEDNVLILTGATNFVPILGSAHDAGLELASVAVRKLYLASRFFRYAVADRTLSPLAQTISEKSSRSRKDPNFVYPLWEFKMDMAALEKKAGELGLAQSEIDELRNGIEARPKSDGYLMWYYARYGGFMLQWIMLAVAALLIVMVGKRFIPASTYERWGLSAVVVGLNAWAFKSKPDQLPLQYWLIPGAIFVLSFIISLVVPGVPSRQVSERVGAPPQAEEKRTQA